MLYSYILATSDGSLVDSNDNNYHLLNPTILSSVNVLAHLILTAAM